MSLNNRRIVTNTRTINYSPGGLNERFASLTKNQGPNMTTIVSQRPQQIPRQNQAQRQEQQPQKSVFSRLKAIQPMNKNKIVQQRLGKMVNNNQTRGKMATRVSKPNTNKRINKKQLEQKKKGGKDVKKNDKKKSMSADDLDRSLDAYMMKDPKTAQAKLDAELTSYMSSAPMEEEE